MSSVSDGRRSRKPKEKEVIIAAAPARALLVKPTAAIETKKNL